MNVAIVPLQFPYPHLVDAVQLAISQRFGVTCSVTEVSLSLDAGRDPYRNQVDSTWVLAQLHKLPIPDADKILGIMNGDLLRNALAELDTGETDHA